MITKKQIDDHTERTEYVTTCADCGWTSDIVHLEQGDCTVSVCPECKSDYVIDREFGQWDYLLTRAVH